MAPRRRQDCPKMAPKWPQVGPGWPGMAHGRFGSMCPALFWSLFEAKMSVSPRRNANFAIQPKWLQEGRRRVLAALVLGPRRALGGPSCNREPPRGSLGPRLVLQDGSGERLMWQFRAHEKQGAATRRVRNEGKSVSSRRNGRRGQCGSRFWEPFGGQNERFA